MAKFHLEYHKVDAISWLRAAVLGANDGIVSIACLLLGVAAANAAQENLLLTGVAGLVAGAMSMATGEYVSVHSQADSESAALKQEREELAADPAGEHRELMGIYMRRGLDQHTASKVAEQLMAHDALDAHARDELGISEAMAAKPLQAAVVSAFSFASGAALPLGVAALAPAHTLVAWICASSLLFLGVLGGWAAKSGGANVFKGACRVTFWSSLAMAVTAGAGAIFGAVA
ncbi:VIT family protein [Herbaspirillum sp.]|uniref:VIT1/CCC1 transporter family protein n=1 Tax=Herbaspirillum sp. TaxID=1890675 RepID=UPI001B10F96B|nr:VIT family protein [Herbaspirillum sp.]MBO9537004.1 VIT family protein [Herbaspirillum sp.]